MKLPQILIENAHVADCNIDAVINRLLMAGPCNHAMPSMEKAYNSATSARRAIASLRKHLLRMASEEAKLNP